MYLSCGRIALALPCHDSPLAWLTSSAPFHLQNRLHTRLAIIGSGPAAHTAAIYAARAELEPILFEVGGGLAQP